MGVESKVTKSRKTHHSVETLPETIGNILGLSVKPQTPLSSLQFYLKPANLRYSFQEVIIYHNTSELGQKEVPYHSYDRELPIEIWFPDPTVITGVYGPYITH